MDLTGDFLRVPYAACRKSFRCYGFRLRVRTFNKLKGALAGDSPIAPVHVQSTACLDPSSYLPIRQGGTVWAE